MELVRGLINLSEHHKNCVLTIGNFDGVHIGHQYVIDKLKKVAKQHNVPSAVMIFEPQPQEVFLQDKAAARVLTFREKYKKLKSLGIDRLICIRFCSTFADMTAEQFVANLLVDKLGVKHVIVGDDFRFGQKRTGDFTLLKSMASELGFSVDDSQTFKFSNKRASSTEVRNRLLASDFSGASELLGAAFGFQGRVIHGQKNGRKFGFPTANIAVKRAVLPIRGVFGVKALLGNKEILGVANIGNKPTLNGIKPLLEVHLFDFDEQIYGQRLQITPVFKIRDEKKFDSLDELIAQISLDVSTAKRKFLID
ncbi:bifunctional riboflavin kinase/FAD synthetase [Psychrosphaera sp. B3R10]|uniref:bifunctional riboflavin kinase/FAD synthetase n=1 Tax=unclassified Psychrosphaera TaxID=2641570 RepID=UPI001C09FAE0|nr:MULTISPECIES: bifunctional riboflavin kinase/FAD synthetase [unclassified Psychrosphaera]MBU2881181.1 bifunctional riboflavin kinase/FAD synthetase [Psychrosphaera sp. I2R16]MBU2988286.1 bifunctional riboflavin kinase/FAD synthetase [Psychrosphaera sp. B3R10]MDO6718495.1 bifunctional riboflavin kinase/FAD synthetase [Psychrosphaera sp. 1_MG-2023]